MDYILLIFATILVAAVFACQKFYQKGFGASVKEGFRYSALMGAGMVIISFIMNGFTCAFTPYSAIMSAIKCTIYIGYTIIGFKILKRASMSLYTLFLMSGGMIIPYIWGIFYLDEAFNLLRFFGLLMIFAGVIFSNFTGEKISPKLVIYCISVFILNGLMSISQKVHQIETVYETVGTLDYVILGGIFSFVFSTVMYFVTKEEASENKTSDRKKSIWLGVLIVALAALFNAGTSYLQLAGAKNLPASVLYPIITGGTIVFSTLFGKFMFKESLSKKMIIAIVLCFVGTCLFV